MGHVVLLGDSIFDNAAYVPGHPSVVQQLKQHLPDGWKATLCAVDGQVTLNVAAQLAKAPADATHFVVSVGGNDALYHTRMLSQPAGSVAEVMLWLADVQAEFRDAYEKMLLTVLARGLPTVLCTVYDKIPFRDDPAFGRIAPLALTIFNDTITREAIRTGTVLLDLRLVCTQKDDYSAVSPIEPSHHGGRKIAAAVARVVTEHDFAQRRMVAYP